MRIGNHARDFCLRPFYVCYVVFNEVAGELCARARAYRMHHVVREKKIDHSQTSADSGQRMAMGLDLSASVFQKNIKCVLDTLSRRMFFR